MTASTEGMRRVTGRQRERMVISTSAGEGAHSIHRVRGGGSSIALSSTLVARSVIRSASSMMKIRHRPLEGWSWAAATSSRISSIL